MADRVKRPSYQWYPGDFRRDLAVQACSFEARGLWREMLDLMHDGEPYGHLTAGGVPIDDAQLARIVGATLSKVRRWLRELEERKVFSRTEAGVIYSRRMVKDEHIRQVRAEAGSKGGNPALRPPRGAPDLLKQRDNHPPNQRDEQNPTPAVASASARETTTSSSPADAAQCERVRRELPDEYQPDFDRLLSLVPNAVSWAAELEARLTGLHPPLVGPAIVGRAIRDYLASGAVDHASLRQFRRYIEGAEGEIADGSGGGNGTPRTGGRPGGPHLGGVAARTFRNAQEALRDL